MQSIKIRDMQHSKLNVLVRDKDTPPIVKDGKSYPNPALVKQAQELRRDILRGADILKTPGTIDGKNNPNLGWLPGSVFIVELVGAIYEVLSGRHRLDLLLSFIAEIEAAMKTVTTPEEVTRLQALAESWRDFGVMCDVRVPKDDAERLAIIAEGNSDDPSKSSKIPQSYPSRFLAMFPRVPRPAFVYVTTKGQDAHGRPKIEAANKDSEGWSNGEFQSRTGIRGNFHTTYYALATLGKHFDLSADFFAEGNRLKIKPQITQALLLKSSPVGTGSDVVNSLGFGFVERYCHARAACKGTDKEPLSAALERVRQEYKTEFVQTLMDEAGGGIEALGNAPEKSEDDLKAEKAEKEKEKEAANVQKATLAAASQPYQFARDAMARALNVPNAPEIAPQVGNAFDLLLMLSPERTQSAAEALAAWKTTPSDTTALAAMVALVKALESVEGVTDAMIAADAKETVQVEAAHAKPNTAKGKKK